MRCTEEDLKWGVYHGVVGDKLDTMILKCIIIITLLHYKTNQLDYVIYRLFIQTKENRIVLQITR
jgi:hypothetical protein